MSFGLIDLVMAVAAVTAPLDTTPITAQLGAEVGHEVVLSVEAPSACHAKALSRVAGALPRASATRVLWTDMGDYAYGLAYRERRVLVLSTALPCDTVISTYSHELTHQLTFDSGAELSEQDVERVADCGSEMASVKLGARRYAPYLDGQVDGYKRTACPKGLRSLAKRVLGF